MVNKLIKFRAYNSITHILILHCVLTTQNAVSFWHRIFDPLQPPATPAPLVTTVLLCVCLRVLFVLFVCSFLFYKPYISEMMWLLPFLIRLASLSMLFSRPTHKGPLHLFLWLSNILSCVRTTPSHLPSSLSFCLSRIPVRQVACSMMARFASYFLLKLQHLAQGKFSINFR